MHIKDQIKEIEDIKVGFNISFAKIKLNKVIHLVDYVENIVLIEKSDIPREDIISVLQQVYGISYEIGNTKQQLGSKKDIELARRILPIARLVFKKSKELLPYLVLNLHNSIGDEKLHTILNKKISEIQNQMY